MKMVERLAKLSMVSLFSAASTDILIYNALLLMNMREVLTPVKR